MNLVVNARDVMPNGGQITVRTWVMRLGGQAPSSAPLDVEQGEFVCLAVEDQGSGIPPEVMGRLFEPFFTTKARGKGTGLGLSTSYGIAAQAGGSITADNIEGGGARFTVWLPRVAEESAASAERERPVRSRPAAHILVVEDEPALREVVRRLLVAARHEVYTADSVASARAVAERLGRIDLLLTDGILPDGTGREVADALAALPPERAPRAVLYMSGYTDDDILERGIRAGDARFLPKPFLPEALLRAVDDALEG
jgi:CheY-like chemotaxis protein